MEQINIEDFSKIEMKVGKIIEASVIPESNKLLLLKVSFGQEDIRTVVSGIAKYYNPEDILNKKFVFVTNLAPRPILQYESQAMIMAVHNEDKTIVSALTPDQDIAQGSLVT